jgi:hypothetical protein
LNGLWLRRLVRLFYREMITAIICCRAGHAGDNGVDCFDITGQKQPVGIGDETGGYGRNLDVKGSSSRASSRHIYRTILVWRAKLTAKQAKTDGSNNLMGHGFKSLTRS